ncbi:methionine--tRNA ligase [Nanoarchaeota archaeon]
MTRKKFYVTTAIDYVNAKPHIGHAYQKIVADVLARWNKIRGKEVFFITGTDEYGQKIANSAMEAGKNSQEFVDDVSKEFKKSWNILNIDFDRFIRTTDEDHKEKVKEFVKLMEKKGDIYKGEYSGDYCEGCEAYITKKDIIDNKCPFHPNKELKQLAEETYFFRLSKYEDKLLDLYEKNSNYILPLFRKKEIINRVKSGLKDLNIARLKENMNWGIDFPIDDKYVIYVWYEALLNYITGIDWPNKKFEKFWPADVQLLGIDNSWFHCVIWPAMLMSVGIEPAKTILINGFLTIDGQKISKSLGNIISPKELLKKYSADSIRYFVCRNFVFGQDGDFSQKALIQRHNDELADKLGNLVSRVSGLIEKNGVEEFDWEKSKNEVLIKRNIALTNMNLFAIKLKNLYTIFTVLEKSIEKLFENYEFDKVLNEIFNLCFRNLEFY